MSAPLQQIHLIDGSDVADLFRSLKKRLFFLGCLGACFAFALMCWKGISYTIEASFKEELDTQESDGKNAMKQWFFALPSFSMTQTQFLMKSHVVLRPVVDRLGLQAKVLDTPFSSFVSTFFDLCLAECRFPLQDSKGFFAFSDLSYEGEKTLDLTCQFILPDTFELFYKGQKIKEGKLLEPLSLALGENLLHFTLKKIPTNISLHRPYTIRIFPWQTVVSKLQKKISILPHKTNLSLYRLVYQTSNRCMGAEFLNELMAELQHYFRYQHDLFAKQQLAYLAERQKELLHQFEAAAKRQAYLISEHVADEGYLDASQKLQLFLDPYIKLKEKLLAVHFELQQLENGSLSAEDPFLSSYVQDMQAQMRHLEQQKDFFEIKPHFEVAELNLNETQKNNLYGSLLEETDPSFRDWETIKNLYRQYLEKLDQSEVRLKSLKQTAEHFEREELQPSFLMGALKDSMSEQLIREASALRQRLKEDKYCSLKERLRWQEELLLQQNLLKDHVAKLIQAEEEQIKLLQAQIATLQVSGLHSIHRHMQIIEQNIQDQVSKRQKELLQEKKLLEKQMSSLRSQLADFPETWQADQVFKLQSKAHQTLMETVAELMETKTIGHHLHQVGSKPIDLAYVPLLPNFPYFLLSLFTGAFITSGSYFFAVFFRRAAKGFGLNKEKLCKLGLSFSGDLFLEDKSHLNTFRNLCFFTDALPKAQVLGVFGGKGRDFSLPLASFFAKTGRRVCVFCFGDVHRNFFSHQNQEGVDIFQETDKTNLQENSFNALFSHVKQSSYEIIILFVRSGLETADAKAILPFCDKIVISLQGDPIDILTPFISWAYDRNYSPLTFVASR